MQIVIVRHARVKTESTGVLDTSAMNRWLKVYDTAEIETTLPEDGRLIDLVEESRFLVCSQLPRTAASLKVLGKSTDLRDALFDEIEIPPVRIPWLRLSPKLWLTMIRLLSLAGVGRYGRSLQQSRVRAERAAERLITLAEEHEHVLLLGHGAMNWLIVKVLKQRGWDEVQKMSLKNWGYGHFRKIRSEKSA